MGSGPMPAVSTAAGPIFSQSSGRSPATRRRLGTIGQRAGRAGPALPEPEIPPAASLRRIGCSTCESAVPADQKDGEVHVPAPLSEAIHSVAVARSRSARTPKTFSAILASRPTTQPWR